MSDESNDDVAPTDPVEVGSASTHVDPGVFLTPPLQLSAVEYQGAVGAGMTGAMQIAARSPEGEFFRVVLKLRDPGTQIANGNNGHFRATSLACEMVCAVLARALGLRGPDYAVVRINAEFANTVRDDIAHRRLVKNLGPNYGTVQLNGYVPWRATCSRQSEELRDAVESVVAFDAAIMNGDRRANNSNLLWDGSDDVRVIDHGLALLAHQWPDDFIDTSPLPPDHLVQDHCGYAYLRSLARTYGSAFATWGALMTPGAWQLLQSYIPPEWEERPGDLGRIFRFLLNRPGKFNELSLQLQRILK